MGIEKAFTNLAQATAEDRVTVTNLTDANRHLAAQVAAQVNNMATKDADMENMQKIVLQLQGELKTLKSKQAGQSTNNANPSSYKKGNWWRIKYFWTHGIVRHAGDACLKKAYGHKDKATFLNRMGVITRGIQEGAWRLGTNTIDKNNTRLMNNDFTNVLEYIKHTNNNCNNCRGKPPNNNPTYGIADTGATQNYTKVDTPRSNKIKTSQGPQVILPDGSIMQATHKAELNLSPLLSTRSKIAHIFPHLQSWALISIRQLCDDGCTATFNATTLTIHKQGEKFLKVNLNGEAGMWQVKLTPPQGPTPTHQSANILMADRTKPELGQWYHATLLIPVKQTLIQAIKKGYFATCPYLTTNLINKHLPQSMATSKGHMHQTQKNLEYTKTQELKTPEEE